MRYPAPVNSPMFVSGVMTPAWMEWFQRVAAVYSDVLQFVDAGAVNFGQAEPENPFDGLLAFADGVNWNPGSGRGYYEWDDDTTSWLFIGVPSSVFFDHSARHENSGADEITLTGLSGEAADEQKSKLASSSVRGGVKIGDTFSVDGSEYLVLDVQTTGGIDKTGGILAIKVRAGYGLVTDANGLALKQQAAEGDVTTADATEITTAIALANALKTKLNAVLAKLRSAEVIAT